MSNSGTGSLSYTVGLFTGATNDEASEAPLANQKTSETITIARLDLTKTSSLERYISRQLVINSVGLTLSVAGLITSIVLGSLWAIILASGFTLVFADMVITILVDKAASHK